MTQPEEKSGRPKTDGGRRRWPRRLGIAAAAVLGVVLLAIAGLYLTAQSAAGRSWILARIEAAASTPGETEVTLRGLHGRLPHDLRLERLALGDRDGTWLTAENVALVWRPLALLRGRLEVQKFEAASLAIARAPTAPEATPEETSGPTGLPRLPVTVAVERLAIDELALGPALLGAPARLTVQGEARADQAARVDASLVVERRDEIPGRLAASARYDPGAETLALELEFAEPAGGLAARLLALPALPALSLTLSGEGPIASWQGRLTAEAQDLAEIGAEIALTRNAAELGLAVTGEATVTPPDDDELLRRVLAGPTRFALDARWHDARPLRIERLAAETDTLALNASGLVDLDTLAGQIEANARLRDAALLAVLRPDLAAETVELTLTGDGPLLQPRLTLDATITELRLAPVALRRARVQANFDPLRPLDAGPPQGAVTAEGRVEGLEAPAPAEVLALLQPGFDWRLDGNLDLAAAVLDLAQLEVSGTGARAAGSGVVALDAGEFDAGATLELDDLSGLASLVGLDLAGASRIEARATNTAEDGALSGTLAADFTSLRLGEPIVQALLGPTPRFGGDFALLPSGDLQVTELSVTGAGTQVSGDATLRDDFAAISADYRARVNDVAVLSDALGVALAGAATLSGTAEGALENPALAGRLELARGSLAGTAIDTASARFDLRDPAAAPTGHVALEGSLPDFGTVAGDSDFALREDALALDKLTLTALQTTAAGTLTVPLDGGALAGGLSLDSPDIGPLLARAGLAGGGGLQGRIDLGPGESGQAATLDAQIAQPRVTLDGPALAAESLAVRIAAEDLLGTPRATAEAMLRGATRDALRIETLQATAEGTLESADFEVTAQGDFDGPLALDAAGRVALAETATTVEVTRLAGRAFAQDFALRAPATLRQGGNAVALRGLDLALGEARLTAEAALDPEAVALTAELARLDLAALRPFGVPPELNGRAAGRIAVEGPRDAPRGDLALALTELRSAALPEEVAMTLDLSGRWEAQRLALDGRLTGLPGAPARLTAELPLALEGETLALSLPPEAPLSGRLDWQGDAATVWPLVPISGHRLAGDLTLNLALDGRPAEPRLTGRAALADGEYENFETGTILTALGLRLDLEGDRVVLSQLSAGDGNGGRLTGSGSAGLDPARNFPFELTAEIEDFTAVRRDEVTARASGTLGAEGDARAAVLSARLETQNVELRIPEKLPPNVVELDVVETGGGKTQLAAAAPAETQEPVMDLQLDVAIDMPRRVFLRGRGLDSEWSGRFAVTGPAEAPVIDGRLEIVRGQLTLLGKTFRLARGQVTLPADADIDPLLDLEAVHQGKSIAVTARITGRASNPSFALSSVPEYPRDEIISRLLFDKGAGELSAVEAAQLAAAVAELSGVGGGGGAFMDRFRNLLGVDVLSLEAAKGGGPAPAIGAGKYLSDDVYVGVQKDVGSEAGSVEVEVELTPNISVQSGVESTGESDIGIEFKWDY